MTIKDIANLAGVSIATVSKVINGKDQNISDKTRNKVLEIVEREGYIPNGVAKSLKIRRTKTIGLIMPDVTNPFFADLARGAEDAAQKKGYSLILCNTDNKMKKEEKYLSVLKEKMVDGIIMTSSENNLTSQFKRPRVPMVLVDRDISADKNIGRITVDSEKASYDATAYLIGQGCRNIGFISSRKTNRPSVDRLRGYKRALKENGLQLEEHKIFLDSYSVESGVKGALTLLLAGHIDGICCGNDLIAMGAMKALQEKGIRIPHDIKIIGFDDIYIAQYMNPPLTTIKQPIYELGQEAVRMLVSIIEKKDIKLKKILNHELIKRGSA